jgi:hypothetical protein
MGKIGYSAKPYPEDYFPSVVLLLKNPLFPSAEVILKNAQASWGANAPVELVATMRQGASHVFRSGAVIFSVHTNPTRYGSLAEGGSEILMRTWNESGAWMSIDMPTERCNKLREQKALGDIYKVLLIYAFMCWSENCLGVYFPAEGAAVPNLGGLAESIQWGRRNGLDLAFLN